MTKISIDNSGHLDLLGRVAFARHLLDLTERIDAESSGAVLGLEGTWGSGKTRVLTSLESLVDERPEDRRPILIRFNPWMVSGTPGLVEALLLQMAADLAPDVEGIRRRIWRHIFGNPSQLAALATSLIDYASILGTVKNFAPVANMLLPGSGHLLAIVGDAAESAAKVLGPAKGGLARLMKHPGKLSLVGARRKIETLLRELGRRVIIVVDDLDRLPPRELASMVQAIKAVADFPNVVYVLAYDPEIAAEAVRVALDLEDGRAFLEKIVQIPLPLPEVPTSRLNAFAIDRLKSSVELVGIPGSAQQDLAGSWALVAALMVTPRDIERLRTRLLVATPIMQDQVNTADVVLLEALSLKAPQIIEWIQGNVTAIISPGLSQYDDELVFRGQVGDRMADAELAAAGGKDRNEKRAFEWESLLPSEPRSNLPVRNAMAYLFDRCDSIRNSSPKRSSFRRVQEYRYWYRWRCYHDHHERWTTTEMDKLLREPKRILEAGLHRYPDVFREFCQQACDIGLISLDQADSMALVAVYRQAEEVLGTDLLIQWDVGFGPLDALFLALRLDQPNNRVHAIESLIEQVSVWLSGRVVMEAWREIFKPRGEGEIPAARRFVPSGEALAPILERWFAVADARLSDSSWSTFSAQLTPYTLLSWMNIMLRDAGTIRRVGAKFIQDEPARLAEFFAGFADRPEFDVFPLSVVWDILPNAQQLKDLTERLPDFLQTHSKFMAELHAQAEKVALVSQLANILSTVAQQRKSAA